jgi:hypothetical protein
VHRTPTAPTRLPDGSRRCRGTRRLRQAAGALLAVVLPALVAGCALYGRCAADDCADDAAISAEVRAMLVRHPEFGPANGLDVLTRHRVVYLYGLVDTELERREIEALAGEAGRALRVVNLIGVQNGAR